MSPTRFLGKHLKTLVGRPAPFFTEQWKRLVAPFSCVHRKRLVAGPYSPSVPDATAGIAAWVVACPCCGWPPGLVTVTCMGSSWCPVGPPLAPVCFPLAPGSS